MAVIVETFADFRYNNVWELKNHGTWWSITKTHQFGKSTMNEYGGYNTQNLGSEKYVKQKWRDLKRYIPTITYPNVPIKDYAYFVDY